MLALIAGTGDLPAALLAALPTRPLVCALAGFDPVVPPDVTFRIEHLGSFLADLKARGVTQVCMAGAVQRPPVDPSAIDAATMPLVPVMMAAMGRGDDGALRGFITVLEQQGFAVVAAHEVAPDLLPDAGVLVGTLGDRARADAMLGEATVADMGAQDQGQACVIGGDVLAREDRAGTDAMLQGLGQAAGALLFKAPKPGQDRRADLPVIGPATARNAVTAGLAGIVIEAGGVMVLDLPRVIATLTAAGLFLWVRPKGSA